MPEISIFELPEHQQAVALRLSEELGLLDPDRSLLPLEEVFAGTLARNMGMDGGKARSHEVSIAKVFRIDRVWAPNPNRNGLELERELRSRMTDRRIPDQWLEITSRNRGGNLDSPEARFPEGGWAEMGQVLQAGIPSLGVQVHVPRWYAPSLVRVTLPFLDGRQKIAGGLVYHGQWHTDGEHRNPDPEFNFNRLREFHCELLGANFNPIDPHDQPAVVEFYRGDGTGTKGHARQIQDHLIDVRPRTIDETRERMVEIELERIVQNAAPPTPRAASIRTTGAPDGVTAADCRPEDWLAFLKACRDSGIQPP